MWTADLVWVTHWVISWMLRMPYNLECNVNKMLTVNWFLYFTEWNWDTVPEMCQIYQVINIIPNVLWEYGKCTRMVWEIPQLWHPQVRKMVTNLTQSFWFPWMLILFSGIYTWGYGLYNWPLGELVVLLCKLKVRTQRLYIQVVSWTLRTGRT